MQGLKHLDGKPGKLENSGKVEKYIEKTGKNQGNSVENQSTQGKSGKSLHFSTYWNLNNAWVIS